MESSPSCFLTRSSEAGFITLRWSGGTRPVCGMRNVDAPQPISTADSVEAEEHDGQQYGETDHPRGGPPMSVCVQCAQPTVGPDDLCSHHTVGHGADWATGNRIMCDF